MPDTISRSADFAELVYADPDWVRAEFDAIMAANFLPVLPAPRPGSAGPRRPGRGAFRWFTAKQRPGTPAPTSHCLRRQRSPPPLQ
jgi:hypothetical protein